jgi:hypothetical protein
VFLVELEPDWSKVILVELPDRDVIVAALEPPPVA